MEYAYNLNGGIGAPLFKKYQIAETLIGGIPCLIPAAGEAGVSTSSTTSFADTVGVTLDGATFVTAQQTDGTSAERLVSVIISPDAVFRALMSGGAAEGTALDLHAVTTASTDGLVITTGTEWSSPTFDEGVAWGFDGANAGASRKITSVSGTAGTVTVAFDQDTVVGDNFLRAPWWHMDKTSDALQLTTLLTQADASIVVGTGGDVKIIDMELNDNSLEGRTHSYVLFAFDDHTLNHSKAGVDG